MNRFVNESRRCRWYRILLLSSVVGGFVAPFPGLAQSLPTSDWGPLEQRVTPAVDWRSLPSRVFQPHFPMLSLSNLPIPEPVFPEAAPEVRLVIRLNERRVYVYQDEQVYTSYPIAVGRAGWETPTGEYAVLNMVRNPGWQNPFTGEIIPPGPDNPLGERWIGFWTDGQNFIGFHGTPNAQSVGRAASHGCIRMYNRDVQELFEMVALGTPVTVQP
jgi:lipoprotein-anchoring transpeptidase ErfK/SrfK